MTDTGSEDTTFRFLFFVTIQGNSWSITKEDKDFDGSPGQKWLFSSLLTVLQSSIFVCESSYKLTKQLKTYIPGQMW